MLDFSSIASIRDEIDRAEYFRDLHLQTPKELREWFCGQGYRDGYGVNHPENAVHAYISMVLPRIIHDNPKVRVTSARPQVQRTACVAMKAALNRWSKMTKVRGTIERIATDMLLGWGVSLTVNEPKGHERKWDGDGPYLPRVYRIDPARFIIDPAAMHWEEARFMGHVWVTDKEDLLRRAEMDETWNKEVIEGLATNNGVDELRDSRDIPERYELAIYEIWVPEMDEAAAELIDEAADDALFNGTIWTIAKYQGGTDKCECQLIRKPLPYYGPATGPYTVFGAFTVPNDPYPLSPIVACRDQIQYCNDMALSQQENQKRYKRILVGDAKNPKFLQDVVNAPDMYVFAEAGLDARSLQPVEVGGSTNQHIQSVETAKERLDRALGMSDAMRGNVAGSASATEVAVAESASTMRIAHLKRAFQDACDTVFRSVGWYMFHDGRISIPVGGEDTRAVGMTDPVFVGGLKVGAWEDMQIDVDAYSMERTSEMLSQKRALETFQVITTAAQAIPAMPWVKWRDLLSFLGDAQNVPQMQDFIDESVLQQMQQAQQAAPTPSGIPAEGGVPSGGPSPSPTGEPQAVPARAQAAIQGAAARF
jgi:hypothetical protein